MIYLMMILLAFMAVFLIMLVLVQRGRGGGLAGAFGGMGGQSAFGTKAGDLFTRVTIVVAAVWIIMCIASVKLLSNPADPVADDFGRNAPQRNQTGTLPGGARNTSPKSTPKKSPAQNTTRPKATGGAAKTGAAGSSRPSSTRSGAANPPADAP